MTAFWVLVWVERARFTFQTPKASSAQEPPPIKITRSVARMWLHCREMEAGTSVRDVGNRLIRLDGFENKEYLEPMQSLEPDVEAVRRQLERIRESSGFARNERLSRFLQFVVEGHLDGKDRELKESIIAIEVFGRRPD